MKRIYLDNAATSPLVDKAREEMLKVMEEVHGNPSSAHTEGRKAKSVLERYRAGIAEMLGAQSNEVVFTSGATEADNLALTASAATLITSLVEHKAILEPAQSRRLNTVLVSPNPDGTVDLKDDLLRVSDPGLVSLMWVNNETGAITNIAGIAAQAKEHGWLVHSDAVQALVFCDINFHESPVDMMSFSAHKIGGPKGIGVLLKKSGVKVRSLAVGGGQERGLRPGTENLLGVAGLYGALKSLQAGENRQKVLQATGKQFEEVLTEGLGERVRINAPSDHRYRAPHILNFTFFNKARQPLDSEILLHQLDRIGIACSTGSACTSGAIEPSHVLTAMGISREEAAASLRFSLAPTTHISKVEEAAQRIVNAVRL